MNIPLLTLLACLSSDPVDHHPVIHVTYAGFPGWTYLLFLAAVFLGIGLEMKRRAKAAQSAEI